MKESKTSPIVVIFIMIILILFIALPPIFRVYFKEETQVTPTNKSNANKKPIKKKEEKSKLSCYNVSIGDESTDYSIDISVEYINSKAKSSTITYSINNESFESELIDEFSKLINNENVVYTQDGTTNKIVINESSIENDSSLEKYLLSIDEMEKYYINYELTCLVVE